MKELFKDPKIQAEFAEKGYVIVPFLNDKEVNQLLNVYHENFGQVNVEGLYPTHRWSSFDLNTKMNDAIVQAFKRTADEILLDYKFFLAHYMTKSNIDSKEFELHQDWSIVEEDKNQVAQIWCPLSDTSPQNGGMFLMERSHKFFNNYRSGSLHRFYIKVGPKTEKYITPLHIKAGHALFYHNGLLHGSYPNKSDHVRIVAMGNVTPREAPFVYFQKSAETPNQVDIYGLSREILLENLQTFEKGGIADSARFIRSVNYLDKEITESHLLQKIKETYKTGNAFGNLISRLLGI